MDCDPNRFVPKVHPLSRPLAADDPMTLRAVSVEGDPELMIQSVAQEFACLGWDAEHILDLFREPGYPLLFGIFRLLGEASLRGRIEAVLRRGVPRLRVTVWEAPVEESFDPGLVELGPLSLKS